MDLKIMDFHRYIKKSNELKNTLAKMYQNHEINSEADLQSAVWMLLWNYIKLDKQPERFKVLNKPHLKDLHIHPDLVIFRKKQEEWHPFIIIELKEKKNVISKKESDDDFKRMLQCKDYSVNLKVKVKRCYFICVSKDSKKSDIQRNEEHKRGLIFIVPITHVDFKKPINKEWSKKHDMFRHYTGTTERE